MKRVPVLACAAALAAIVSAPAWAGVGATVLLKSGSRMSCEVLDLDASGLRVRVGGSERAIPIGEVAVIDFQGDATNLPRTETSRAAGGLVVLRNGQIVEARLHDLGGTSPLRVTVDASGNLRDYNSDQVARVYLAPVPGGGSETVAPPAGEAPGQKRVRVEGTSLWTPTGIYVGRGERVFISAEGEIRLSADPNDIATPYGSTTQRYAARAPLPRELAGSLIGRIGDRGQPFGLGNPNGEVPMPGDGQLWLGVNDDAVGDNAGAFTVEVRGGRQGPTPRRR